MEKHVVYTKLNQYAILRYILDKNVVRNFVPTMDILVLEAIEFYAIIYVSHWHRNRSATNTTKKLARNFRHKKIS